MDSYEYCNCKKCQEHDTSYNPNPIESYSHLGTGTPRIMLIGQDPTIRRNQDKVKKALMLDMPKSSLSRWIKEIFGEDNFKNYAIYATNAVKCILKKFASDNGGSEYLLPMFINCKKYLEKEIELFKPEYIFTFGEPCHQLFLYMLDKDEEKLKEKLRSSFGENFREIKFKDCTFRYSPILHIHTYRVADGFGDKMKKFKEQITKHIG